jgi:hypothetical protein
VDGGEPVTETGQTLSSQAQGLAVAVDAHDPSARALVKHQLAVAAHPHGGVHHDRTRFLQRGCEQLEDAAAHDGDVPGLRCPTSVHRCVFPFRW